MWFRKLLFGFDWEQRIICCFRGHSTKTIEYIPRYMGRTYTGITYGKTICIRCGAEWSRRPHEELAEVWDH